MPQWRTCFILDGTASGVTKRRHDVTFPLCDMQLFCSIAEKIVCIFLQDLSKRKHCLYQRSADFSYEKPMHDRIS
jgi:hypothetical protein